METNTFTDLELKSEVDNVLINPSMAILYTDLYYMNIKTVDDYEKALETFDISHEVGFSFLNKLMSDGLLSVNDSEIVVNRDMDWSGLGSDPQSGELFVPEVFQRIARRGLKNKTSSNEDKFLNFAMYLDFPDNEEILSQLRNAHINFHNELTRIYKNAKQTVSKSKNVYSVALGSCKLNREDF